MDFSAFWSAPSFAAFFPQSCLHCNAFCEEPLCTDCQTLLRAFPRHCRSCSRPLPQAEVCGACLRKPPEIEALFIVCCFEHVVRDVVLAAKYAANRRALALMATMMSQCSLPAVDVLLPMPISRGRLLQRGFNQTHYLAAAMAKHYDLPMNKALLVKQGRAPQSSLAARLRRKNIRGAFSVQGACPPSVLLLDDVYTTGATMREAARTLKDAGAQRVYAAVFAAALFD